MNWKRHATLASLIGITAIAFLALYLNFREPVPNTGDGKTPVPAQIPVTPATLAPPVPSRDGLLTRGQVEDWLMKHNFTLSPEDHEWTKLRTTRAEIAELTTLIGAREGHGFQPPPGLRTFGSGGVSFSFNDDQFEAPEEEQPPNHMGVDISDLALPRADSLVVPNAKVDPAWLRRVLRVEGFSSRDDQHFLQTQMTYAAARSISVRLGLWLQEILPPAPATEPVFLYDWNDHTGAILRGLSRADFIADRADARVDLAINLDFQSTLDFPPEDPRAATLNAATAIAFLRKAGFIEAPAGVFSQGHIRIHLLQFLIEHLGLGEHFPYYWSNPYEEKNRPDYSTTILQARILREPAVGASMMYPDWSITVAFPPAALPPLATGTPPPEPATP